MDTDRIVSSDSEQLILVDDDDRETGHLSKSECHDGDGVLHRAFSVFLFDAHGALLLQQRAAGKRLWPLYWSNSCCSHPRRGESMDIATRRRLQQELNIDAELEFAYKFSYHARYDELGAEHELCWVYLGRTRGDVVANTSEIAALRYVKPRDLDEELERSVGRFTPWFQLEWRRLREQHGGQLGAYCNVA